MKLVAANRSHYWSSAINLKSRETECADRDAVRGIELNSCRAKLPPPNSLPSPSQLRPYAQLAGAKSHTERPIQSARGGPPCGSRPTGRSGLWGGAHASAGLTSRRFAGSGRPNQRARVASAGGPQRTAVSAAQQAFRPPVEAAAAATAASTASLAMERWRFLSWASCGRQRVT